MAVSRALRRLLRVLNLEEEQAKLALESALGELHRLERAVTVAGDQARAGRLLVSASAQSGELPDRLAGLEESRAAKRRAEALAPRIAAAHTEVESRRQAFFAKRIECRQAQTLISEAEARDALESGRRAQQSLDSWYLNSLHAAAPASRAPGSAPAELPANEPPQAPATSSQTNLSEDLPKPTINVLNRETPSRF